MLKFNTASADSFIVIFSEEISLEISDKIKFYFDEIKRFDHIIDVVPSYTTIMITFDIFKTSFEELKNKIDEINIDTNINKAESKLIEIPAYYGQEVGLDLQRMAELNKLSIQEIIDIHSSKIYTVFTIGFAPGFAYLGQVDEKIATPRLQSPRKVVNKGSIAIADTQTAIYPQNSPGGWNIIGATTFNLFDKNIEGLCPFSMGDKVKFNQISKDEFLKLGGVL